MKGLLACGYVPEWKVGLIILVTEWFRLEIGDAAMNPFRLAATRRSPVSELSATREPCMQAYPANVIKVQTQMQNQQPAYT